MKYDPLPIKPDLRSRGRVKADSEDLRLWWERHRYSYASSIPPKGSNVVYFIQDGEFIKIGIATGDATERIESLQCGNPRPLTLLGTVPGARREERELHLRFAHLRVRGEWFKADNELVDHVQDLLRDGCNK